MENMYELTPQYDARASFYKKAFVTEECDGFIIKSKKLWSYGTLVAEIKNGIPVIYMFYSNTTSRHIKEFLKQNGFMVKDRKDMEQYFKEEE